MKETQRIVIFGSDPGSIPEELTANSAPEVHTDAGFNPLQMALSSEADSVILFGGPSEKVWTIKVRHVAPAPKPRAVVEVVGGGFLGLGDPVDFEPEPEKPRKWWQRILE